MPEHDENPRAYVVMVGNPTEGWHIVGPFDEFADAAEWCESLVYVTDTWVMSMEAPPLTQCSGCGTALDGSYCPKCEPPEPAPKEGGNGLIAAAPDMLATLKAVLKGIPDDYDDAHTLALLARVEWAINKAKGVESACECCSAPPCQEEPHGE